MSTILFYFVEGSSMSDLLFNLFGFVCIAYLGIIKQQQIYLFGRTQTSETGGQPYSDTSSYKYMSIHSLQ